MNPIALVLLKITFIFSYFLSSWFKAPSPFRGIEGKKNKTNNDNDSDIENKEAIIESDNKIDAGSKENGRIQELRNKH